MQLTGIILTLLLAAASAWLLGVLLMVRARLYPPRLSPIRALLLLGRAHPDDLGFAYTPLRFEVKYAHATIGLQSALILQPQLTDHMVIVLHGFADSSAGSAAWLPLLTSCGANVLLLDLPGHGESDTAPCSAGWFERDAIRQVITHIQKLHPLASRRVTLFGISMGAATALAAACDDPRIGAVIADSPFADFRKACRLHARLFGLPGQAFQRPATWLIERRYGIRFEEIAPAHLLAKVPCPLLLIQSELDQFVDQPDAEVMRQAVRSRADGKSREITIAGAAHILGLAKSPDPYRQAVREFLQML